MSAKELLLSKRAATVSLALGVILLAVKFWAFNLTHSQAIFSDAMESIVNVVASGLAVFVVNFASQPADRDHPYGHGKIEYFSAAFEGGLITFAAMLIFFEAVRSLIFKHQVEALGLGVYLTLATGTANMLLGLYLIWVGKKTGSLAIRANGQHLISDFWTSVAVVSGLILVKVTGLTWIDSAVALIGAAALGAMGVKLVRQSVGGLLDAEDRESLQHLVEIIGKHRPEGIIQVHHCRVIRAGRFHHIDAHVVVPEYWDVAEAHNRTEAFEAELIAQYPNEGELHLHVDPCRRAYCEECDITGCAIRMKNFVARRELTVDELTHPEEPVRSLN